jgi:hypothetical protein
MRIAGRIGFVALTLIQSDRAKKPFHSGDSRDVARQSQTC